MRSDRPPPPGAHIPPEPPGGGCLGTATLLAATVISGLGLIVLFGSGLCTITVGLSSPDLSGLVTALIFALPGIVIGYRLLMFGLSLYQRDRAKKALYGNERQRGTF